MRGSFGRTRRQEGVSKLNGPALLVLTSLAGGPKHGHALLKDIEIIAKAASDAHSPTPLFAAATQLYQAAAGQGMGRLEAAAVMAVLERMAGIER